MAKKPPCKGSGQQRLVLKGARSEDEACARDIAAIESQKAWAYKLAASMERGEPPSQLHDLQMLAAILRGVADQQKAAQPKRRPGNPAFESKIYDPGTAVLMVRTRKLLGDSLPDAIAAVADFFEVDDSTIRKLYREHRNALETSFSHVRVLGKGRGNSE